MMTSARNLELVRRRFDRLPVRRMNRARRLALRLYSFSTLEAVPRLIKPFRRESLPRSEVARRGRRGARLAIALAPLGEGLHRTIEWFYGTTAYRVAVHGCCGGMRLKNIHKRCAYLHWHKPVVRKK
jgi:hypothetical protein